MKRNFRWISGGIAATVLIGATFSARLWAQNNQSNVPQSAEEAAKTFIVVTSGNPFLSTLNTTDFIDDTRLKTIDPSYRQRLAQRLLKFVQFNAVGSRTLLSSDRKRANVTVETLSRPKVLPPVACVQVAGGWKVDILETARNWIGSDDPLLKEIDAALVAPNPEVSALPADDPKANALCQNRLKQIGLALAQYVQDYDEKLPPADKWNDALSAYVKNDSVLGCPVLGPNGYGYAMNWKLSKRGLSEVSEPGRTVVVYESNVPKRNANFDGRDLIYRHQLPDGVGANFLYLDGRVARALANEEQNFRLKPVPSPNF